MSAFCLASLFALWQKYLIEVRTKHAILVRQLIFSITNWDVISVFLISELKLLHKSSTIRWLELQIAHNVDLNRYKSQKYLKEVTVDDPMLLPALIHQYLPITLSWYIRVYWSVFPSTHFCQSFALNVFETYTWQVRIYRSKAYSILYPPCVWLYGQDHEFRTWALMSKFWVQAIHLYILSRETLNTYM